MRLTASLLALWLLLVSGHAAQGQKKYPPSPHVAPTDPLPPAAQARTMKVPPGFELQLVAAEPDIKNPMNIAFDAKGRLWVTMSSEYPFPAKDPAKTADTVKVLEDFGPDGRARKVTTFADNVNIPIGVLPYKNGALVYSIPHIWYMEDTDGDGKADKRTELYSAYGFKDTHGMTGEFTRGFDGWVYVCHGFANESTVKAKDGGTQITMQSGNTYRIRPDGSRVEHWTHGQVNPFGLAFDPLGNLYSADCHTRPIYQLLRGAWYPSFGKPHDGLGFGPEMMTHSHGSTAIAGVACYAADHYPAEYRDNLFIGNVVTNRVNRDSLKRHGSTYLAVEQPDFVTSTDPWFRPVDIKLGPDGALYIADFYNRIIGHYEVPLDHPGRTRDYGRVWRVIYRGDGGAAPAMPRADWTKATTAELIEDLAHPNLTVRLTATHELAGRGSKEVKKAARKAFTQPGNAYRRAHALWVLHRMGDLDGVTLGAAAKDTDALVRVHAMRVLSELPGWTDAERDLAVAGTKDEDWLVRRGAAEALGAHPSVSNLDPLLELRWMAHKDDSHLLHAVRMALRDQLKAKDAWKVVNRRNWPEEHVRYLADVSLGVPGPEAAEFLAYALSQVARDRGQLVAAARHVARYGEGRALKRLVEFGREAAPESALADCLKAIQQGSQERGAPVPPEVLAWARDLAGDLLNSDRPGRVQAGIEVAATLKLTTAQEQLLGIAVGRERPEGLRQAAAGALAAIDADRHADVLGRVLADAGEPLGLRTRVAEALAGANRPKAQDELLKSLTAAPAKLQHAIALGLAGSRQGAEKLLGAVASGKASARLLQEQAVRQRLGQAKVPGLDQQLSKLTAGLPRHDQKVQELIGQRLTGFSKAKADAALGAKVFEKSCAACHQVANNGAKIAPQLDGLGLRGPERILEDLLDPSRNVDQAFRATTLTLKDGKIVTGLLLRQEGEVYVMADAQGKEQRLTQDQVDGRVVSQMSPMPADLAQQLTESELYHLLAFLLEQRQAPGKQ